MNVVVKEPHPYDFVVPYQHALESEAGKRHLPLYLVGLLSHLDRKNAEKIAAFVDVERLRDFAVPYQRALETEASQRNVHLYLAGLLSPVDRKNAELIAALVDVERLVLQAFIGTAPWDHRPLLTVLVGEVVARLGNPMGSSPSIPAASPSAARIRWG